MLLRWLPIPPRVLLVLCCRRDGHIIGALLIALRSVVHVPTVSSVFLWCSGIKFRRRRERSLRPWWRILQGGGSLAWRGIRHPLQVLPVLMLSRLVVGGRPLVSCSVRSLDPQTVSIGNVSTNAVSVALACPPEPSALASSWVSRLRLSCHNLQDLCCDVRREVWRRS